jgi:pimeloyl-ACP methyl ester carboxylesterase
MLDSIRAARDLLEAHAEHPAALMGISQGGHATLWAAELAPAYAPGLDIAGAVAASPPIDLIALERAVPEGRLPGPASRIEALLVASSWEEVYGIALEELVAPDARASARALRTRCPGDVAPPEVVPFIVDPSSLRAWRRLLAVNSPGHAAAAAPILVVAALADEYIPRATIEPGVERLRRAGSRVELRWVEGDHDSPIADPDAVAAAFAWVLERFREARPAIR